MMPGKKKKMIIVSGGPDVPEELLRAIAEQSMEGEDEEEMDEMDEDGDARLGKELMSVVKRIVESL